jgi:hypothetical protein
LHSCCPLILFEIGIKAVDILRVAQRLIATRFRVSTALAAFTPIRH